MYKIDKENVFWRNVGNETVILNIDTGLYYTLDGAGKIIWDMVVDNKDDGEIIKKIVSTFDVEEKLATKDFKNLLEMLKKEKLIERGA